MMEKQRQDKARHVEIGALEAGETEEALGVVVRGMLDNPVHVAAFGEDRDRRRKSLRRLFGALAANENRMRRMIVARDAAGTIVGVCGEMPSDQCQPTLGQTLGMAPALISLGPGAAGRTMRWLGAWSKQDPAARHSHLGPLAVDAYLQGMGIGSKLMHVYCARMDAAGEDAYLETDKDINVAFYKRFGFEVVREKNVLGITNWFMLRRPTRR